MGRAHFVRVWNLDTGYGQRGSILGERVRSNRPFGCVASGVRASPPGARLSSPALRSTRGGALEQGDLALVIGVVLEESANHGADGQAGSE